MKQTIHTISSMPHVVWCSSDLSPNILIKIRNEWSHANFSVVKVMNGVYNVYLLFCFRGNVTNFILRSSYYSFSSVVTCGSVVLSRRRKQGSRENELSTFFIRSTNLFNGERIEEISTIWVQLILKFKYKINNTCLMWLNFFLSLHNNFSNCFFAIGNVWREKTRV